MQGAEKATSVHYNVGKEVRNAIEKIGGTMPEDLPTPEKSILNKLAINSVLPI